MMANFEYMHSAEKERNTTLGDENASQHVMCIVLTHLGHYVRFSDGTW